MLGLNVFATTGSLTISLNMMEGFLAELYHLSAGWNPYERIALIEQVINIYNSPLFKNVICEAAGYSQDIAADVSYREYLSLLLISKLPAFISNSLIYNKKRRRAFNFGENFINNIYQQDILTSHITGKVNKHLVQLYGLDFQNNGQQFLFLPKKNQQS